MLHNKRKPQASRPHEGTSLAIVSTVLTIENSVAMLDQNLKYAESCSDGSVCTIRSGHGVLVQSPLHVSTYDDAKWRLDKHTM